jgi:alkylglycerol monooxygenase
MGDMANYIAMAIPVFFALIGFELWWVRREARQDAIRLNGAVADISTGALQQILGLFTKAATFGLYAFVWERGRLFDVPSTAVWAWLVCFVGVDFFYYWFHRFSHESNFAWGAHVVHHQSEDMNLAVALRQSALQQFISAPFYIPLALLGFPPAMFLALSSINTLYQFWIHTETIRTLGPLEWVLNTPSHHRVHHGCNSQYIDRNHGGTLIVWDRLFGTFEPERERVVYGITSPPKSWNPVWVNLHYFVELWAVAKQTRRWRDKVQIWFRNPEWRPADVPHPHRDDTPLDGVRYDAKTSDPLGRYALAHFGVAMTVAFLYILRFEDLSTSWKVLGAGFLVWSLTNFGGIFEGRRWVLASEPLRLLAAVAVAAVGVTGPARWPLVGGAAVVLLASAFALWRERGHFASQGGVPATALPAAP